MFEEALLMTRSRHWDFYASALRFHFSQLQPNSKKLSEDGRAYLNVAHFLLGKPSALDVKSFLKLSSWSQLLFEFKNLMVMGEVPKLGQLDKILTLSCPGEKCKKHKWGMVTVLGPREKTAELLQKGFLNVGEKQLDQLLGQIRETYKKIGAY